MKTKNVSLLEKKPHPDGGTYFHIKNVEVHEFVLTTSFVTVKEIVLEPQAPYLLHLNHSELTTLLDFSGVCPFEIIYFDAELEFLGKAYSLATGGGPFRIQTTSTWLLLVPMESALHAELQLFRCDAIRLDGQYFMESKEFPCHYGVFPYLLLKLGKSPYFTQIPIVFDSDLPDSLVPGCYWKDLSETALLDASVLPATLLSRSGEVYQRMLEERDAALQMALVLGAHEAHYFFPNGQVVFKEEIPSGGILLSQTGRVIARNTSHFL